MRELLLERPNLTDGPNDGLDRIGVALADPIRRRILVQLLDGSRCPSDLADTIGTSRSNLSNHLTCLRGCGLIAAQKAGRHLHYYLTSPELTQALHSLLAVAASLPDCDDQHPQEASNT